MSTHTPGPWHAAQVSPRSYTQGVYDADGNGVCLINTQTELVLPRRRADATLIAAAPELLDELRKSADTFGDLALALSLFGKELSAASCRIAEASNRAAIARATGERT